MSQPDASVAWGPGGRPPGGRGKRRLLLARRGRLVRERRESLPLSQKVDPSGTPTESAHPARFSPDDKFSRERITCKKRFGERPPRRWMFPAAACACHLRSPIVERGHN